MKAQEITEHHRTMKTPARWTQLMGMLSIVLCAAGTLSVGAAPLQTENVLLVTADGIRWEEVFRGVEAELINRASGGVRDTNAIGREFWRDTPEERRRALMPFFWSEVASRGQIFGNRDKGSTVRVTNGKNFSYPCYSEILCGWADPRVDSNAKKPNPNVSVLEWLHSRGGFEGKVAAFGCWDVFPYILSRERAGFPVQAGWEIVDKPNARLEQINEILRAAPRVWDSVIYDSFMFHSAMDYLKEKKPRVLYLAFGETDDWAHDGRYDLYLHAARNFDMFVRILWETAQSLPAYRNKTTLIIATDHGRGAGPSAWKDHGRDVAESAFVWFAALGPDTRAKGERTDVPDLLLTQVAATVAAFLGQDFRAAIPQAGDPVQDVLPTR
jgi:hypothetical protein